MNKFKKALLSTLIVAPALMASAFADDTTTSKKATGYVDVRLEIVDGCQIGGGAAVDGDTNQRFGLIDLGRKSRFAKETISGDTGGSGGKFDLTVQCGPNGNASVEMKLVDNKGGMKGGRFSLVNNKDANATLEYDVTTDAAGSFKVVPGTNVLDGVIPNADGRYRLNLYAANVLLDGTQKEGLYSDQLNFEVTF